MTTLYIKDNNGKIRQWSITALPYGLAIEYGIVGGAIITKVENIEQGKVNRTLEEQIDLQIRSRVNRRIDMGYVWDYEEACSSETTNALKLPKPMLAQPLDKVNIDYKTAFVQPKYDGNRCLIANVAGEIIAYSRNGKRITSITHITSNLFIPEGMILDGELYCHGQSLQTIVSWIKRKQENTDRIRYMLYDTVSDDAYNERRQRLWEVVHDNITIAPSFPVNSMEEVSEFFNDARESNYEGAIVRWGDFPYEDGKRSKSLVKVKEWQDALFRIVDVFPSKDGWGLLGCMTNSGKTFRVTPPGTHAEKAAILQGADGYIGRYVAVNYAYLTEEGIPFHPIATVIM